MKLTIGIDPGKSQEVTQSLGMGCIVLICIPSGKTSNLLNIFRILKDHPDVTSIEAVVELVPPFAGKMIPSSASFKLGASCGFINGCLRMAEIPFTLVRPQEWQKGLSGLTGLTSGKRKKVLANHAKRFFPSTKGVTLKTADAILILRHFLINK